MKHDHFDNRHHDAVREYAQVQQLRAREKSGWGEASLRLALATCTDSRGMGHMTKFLVQRYGTLGMVAALGLAGVVTLTACSQPAITTDHHLTPTPDGLPPHPTLAPAATHIPEPSLVVPPPPKTDTFPQVPNGQPKGFEDLTSMQQNLQIQCGKTGSELAAGIVDLLPGQVVKVTERTGVFFNDRGDGSLDIGPGAISTTQPDPWHMEGGGTIVVQPFAAPAIRIDLLQVEGEETPSARLGFVMECELTQAD